MSIVETLDLADSLKETGFASVPGLLARQDCDELIALYSQPERFRSRIDMARFRFGRGEYQYFDHPLPAVVVRLRSEFYVRLVGVANQWGELFGQKEQFPPTLDEFHSKCKHHGQTRPTPLLLHYGPGDYNCLHQDVYGKASFPFQVVVFLSEPGRDYNGGEFLLTEQIPRAQAMGRALLPKQGDALVITTRHRPGRGTRGIYRIGVKHGVSPVTAGERWTLGIIFHDSE